MKRCNLMFLADGTSLLNPKPSIYFSLARRAPYPNTFFAVNRWHYANEFEGSALVTFFDSFIATGHRGASERVSRKCFWWSFDNNKSFVSRIVASGCWHANRPQESCLQTTWTLWWRSNWFDVVEYLFTLTLSFFVKQLWLVSDISSRVFASSAYSTYLWIIFIVLTLQQQEKIGLDAIEVFLPNLSLSPRWGSNDDPQARRFQLNFQFSSR